MSVASRRALLILSYVLAAVAGFVVVAAYHGHAVAVTMLGTPERRLGAATMSLQGQPTREHVSQAVDALTAARGKLAEPAGSVLHLNLLAIAARVTGDEADIRRAMDACRAREWPQCDRESVLVMGTVK